MQHPWVGKEYNSPENIFRGKKILVVGESHYADVETIGLSIPGITIEVVEKYKTGEYNIPFFTRIITMMTGKSADENGWQTVRDAWDSLAFYNYVPVVAASGPREFDHSLWSRGTEEFNDVLNDLRPDLIIVTGYRLWDNAYIRHTDGSIEGGQRIDMISNTIHEGRKIPTLVIRHPSAPGFSGLQQHNSFKQFYDSSAS